MKRYGQADKASSKTRAEQPRLRQRPRKLPRPVPSAAQRHGKQYQVLMDSWRIYEPGPNGERTYLSAEQIDKERAVLKEFMDQSCAEQ